MLATVLDNQECGSNAVVKLSKRECGNNAAVEGDVFKYVDLNDIFEEVGVVKFLDPVNPDCNYFEYEIHATGVGCAIGIGIGGLDYPLNQMPGWCENGIGYHADDGCIFNEGFVEALGPTCTRTDKMGCGVEFSEEDTEFVNVFFTKNDKVVGDVVKLKRPASGLYSIVGMHSYGAQVRYLGHSKRYLPINLLKVS